MSTNKRQFTMRMQPENYDKIRVIASTNKRSLAMQIEYLIEKCITDYETRNGTINFDDDASPSQKQIVQNNHGGTNVLTAGNSQNVLNFI